LVDGLKLIGQVLIGIMIQIHFYIAWSTQLMTCI